MSRNKRRGDINRQNAQYSTGPRTPEGKMRSRMNAFRHNLSGNNLMLQDHERSSYDQLTRAMMTDLEPASEIERQLALKIVDTNFRLNRIAAIENNMLNFELSQRTLDTAHDDATECMIAQTRAWVERANSFDLLGRYESRLTKQLLALQKEYERIQKDRKAAEAEAAKAAEVSKDATFTSEVASFGKTPSPYVMSAPVRSATPPVSAFEAPQRLSLQPEKSAA